MNKNKLVNNQYRKQEFNKRRKFGKAESFCKSNGNCPIFQNCLLEIDQLTNNWNELEEWINEQQEFLKETPTFMGEIYFEHKAMNNTYQNVLDKMKEIKEGNK